MCAARLNHLRRPQPPVGYSGVLDEEEETLRVSAAGFELVPCRNPLCTPAVGAESSEMAKATERVLRSVIAASCSTEGQIIEIRWVHCCTVTCSLGESRSGAAKLSERPTH